MLRKIMLTIALLATSLVSAQAADTSTLAETMRKSLAHCDDGGNYIDSEARFIYINRHCAMVQFQALQSYIDAANACINSINTNSRECTEARIVEKSLLKTFAPPAKS